MNGTMEALTFDFINHESNKLPQLNFLSKCLLNRVKFMIYYS